MKFLLEFGPLVIFFATYKYSGMIAATSAIVVSSVIAFIISYMIDGKISKPLMLSTGLLLVTGSITIFSGDSTFIKMKPTLVYSLFAISLIVGNYLNKPLLKLAMDQALQLPHHEWKILSYRFSIYFIIMAVINEIIWRNFAESFWVNFKVFGALPLTILFIASQMPFMMRHNQSN